MKRLLLPLCCAFLLLLSACLPQNGNGAKSNDPNAAVCNRVANPLQDIELDLVFSDIVSSMLRVNDLMLERIPLSADDEWPARLGLPGDKAYKEWLEGKLSDDFTFFLYYGDMSLADLSIKGLIRRPLIEGAQAIGVGFEHQMRVISYIPYGCDGPLPEGEKAPEKAYCESVKAPSCDCGFFSGHLETQLSRHMTANDVRQWMETPVDGRCMVRSKAVTCEPYDNFNAAFRSLLPRYLLGDVTKAEERINDATDKLRDLFSQKAAEEKDWTDGLKARADAKRKASEERAKLEAGGQATAQLTDEEKAAAEQEEKAHEAAKAAHDKKVQALRESISKQSEAVDREVEVYAKLMESALASPEGVSDNIRLAQVLLAVADSVDANLDKATYGASAMLTKLVVDVVDMAQNGVDPSVVAQAMASEVICCGKVKTAEEALEMGMERVELDLRRVALLLPNMAVLYGEIIRQNSLLGPKVEYLEKLIELDEDRVAAKD